MTVLKFGGSCLKDEKSLERISEIISEVSDPVIVVSALSGVTDHLINLMEDNKQEPYEVIERHFIRLPEILENEYYNRLNEKAEILNALVLLYRRSHNLDFIDSHIQSFGERLSALLLTYFLKSKGVNAVNLESEELGIITRRGFKNAIIDESKSYKSVRSKLMEAKIKGQVPVITGYFGNDSQGHVTLLGRNGSDYTAAFIARVMGDDQIVLYKDVKGFYTADPKKVKDPIIVSKISFDQAFELSSYGAKIVHPYAILEAKKANAEIIIKDFSSGKVGTVISRMHGNDIFVTSKRGLAILRIIIPDAANGSGILFEVLRLLNESGINIIQNFTSYSGLTILVSGDSLKSIKSALEPLDRDVEIQVLREGVSIISVIGDFNDGSQMEIQRRLIDLKDQYGDKVHFAGISSPSISLYLVSDDDIEVEVVNYIHEMVRNG